MSQTNSNQPQFDNHRNGKRKQSEETKDISIQGQIDQIKNVLTKLDQNLKALQEFQSTASTLIDDVKKGEKEKEKKQSADKLRRYKARKYAPYEISSDEEEEKEQIIKYLYKEPIEVTHQRLAIPAENRLTWSPELLQFWSVEWERKATSTWLDECHYDEGLDIWLKLQWQIQEMKELKNQWDLDMAFQLYPQTAKENFEFFVNKMIIEEQSPRMIKIIWEEWKKVFNTFSWFTFERMVNQLIRAVKGGY